MITNQLDFRVPVDQGLQLFTALRRRGVPSEALVFEDEGHWVLKALNSKLWHETVFGWMNEVPREVAVQLRLPLRAARRNRLLDGSTSSACARRGAT